MATSNLWRMCENVMVGKRLLQFLTILTTAWLMILLYMGKHLYQLVEESQRTAMKLDTVTQEAEYLRKENIELHRETNYRKVRAISDDLKKMTTSVVDEKILIKTMQQKFSIQHNSVKSISKTDKEINETLIIKYELSKRKIRDYITEMQYFVTAKLKSLNKTFVEPSYSENLDKIHKHIVELSLVTLNEIEQLSDIDSMKNYRTRAFEELRNEVQSRFHRLQNPADCKEARRLVCSLNKGCGFGCQMHHVIYCMIVAYASNRTMVMNSAGWRYSRKGWEGIFLPVSETCRNVGFGTVYWGKPYNTNAKIAHLPIIDSIFPRPKQLPQAVPRELLNKILQFHETPFHWWIGQICAYLFRYQPSMKEKLEAKKEALGFESPIVGIHVRRTDKIGSEADHHDIDEYMYHVNMYFERLKFISKINMKRVYLATDDKKLLAEAKAKYPDYTFVSDNEASKLADLDHRYTEESLHGIITDVQLLSETDYLVCTFSSQVCRLAYEIMSSKHQDASRKYHSLDDIYYFGGQKEHKVRARFAHKAVNEGEIDLEIGDELKIHGNHWDGFSKGISRRSHLEGTFPSFKVEEIVDVVDFPTY